MWYTHTHIRILLSHFYSFLRMKLCHLQRLDLEGVMLDEVSQAEKDEYCMISLLYGI